MKYETDWIDGLKGIAMLGVVMVHYGCRNIGAEGIFGKIVSNGARGVQMFFIISAYLVFVSLSKRFADSRISANEAIKWIVSRIVRLMPLYYLAILVYLSVNGLRGGGGVLAWQL